MRAICHLATFAFFGVLFSGAPFAHAGENLPQIEAHQFEITPIQISKSGRVYLFNTEPKDLPTTGNVLIVQIDQKPVIALRVLRTDPARAEFIAKKIRRYEQNSTLEITHRYFTVEKIADIIAPPVTAGPNDLNPVLLPPDALDEGSPAAATTNPGPGASAPTQGAIPGDGQKSQNSPLNAPGAKNKPLNVNNFDDELDSSNSPKNEKGEEDLQAYALKDDMDGITDSEKEESPLLNPFDHTVFVMAGLFRNFSNFSNYLTTMANGFSLLYSTTLSRDFFILGGKAPQDDFQLEFGLISYNLVNYDGNNDQYQFLSLEGQLRYDIQCSNSFDLFGYLGIQGNFILSSANANPKTLSAVQGVQPNFGVGLVYTIGPHWLLRLDLGYDKISAGMGITW